MILCISFADVCAIAFLFLFHFLYALAWHNKDNIIIIQYHNTVKLYNNNNNGRKGGGLTLNCVIFLCPWCIQISTAVTFDASSSADFPRSSWKVARVHRTWEIPTGAAPSWITVHRFVLLRYYAITMALFCPSVCLPVGFVDDFMFSYNGANSECTKMAN